MALTKRTYVDGQTVITAENLNAIQDEIINNLAPKSHAASGTTYGAASTTNYGHVKLSNTTPSMDGTAAIGSSTDVARANHVHPSDTSRVPTTRKVNGKGLSADITLASDDIGDDSDAGGSTVKASLSSLKSSLNSKIVRVTGTISSSQLYVTDANVTTDMIPISCEFGTPSNVLSNYTINTNTAGRITFTGITLGGSTTVDVILGIPKS